MLSDGNRLANQVESTLRLFMYLPDEHAYTLASMWVLDTHMRDIDGKYLPYYSGRLYAGSKLPGCGKSMFLRLITGMSYNGKSVLNPTPPSVVASYHELRRTLAIDEFDQYMGRGSGKGTIKTIINGGYEADQYVENVRQGEVVEYCITGPMALGGKNIQLMRTAEAFDTIKTRSHIIELTRKPEDVDILEYDPEIHGMILKGIRDALTDWGQTYAHSIMRRTVTMPKGVINRDKNIWQNLFRIADAIGGDWPRKIESACRAYVLNQRSTNTILTPYDELLAAIRAIFDSTPDADFIPTTDIYDYLMAMPESWWHHAFTSERVASMQIAAALNVYGISKGKQYINGEQVRGYSRNSVITDSDETTKTTPSARDNQDNPQSTVPDDGWD